MPLIIYRFVQIQPEQVPHHLLKRHMLLLLIYDLLHHIPPLRQIRSIFLGNLLHVEFSFEVIESDWDHHEGNDIEHLKLHFVPDKQENHERPYVECSGGSP